MREFVNDKRISMIIQVYRAANLLEFFMQEMHVTLLEEASPHKWTHGRCFVAFLELAREIREPTKDYYEK